MSNLFISNDKFTVFTGLASHLDRENKEGVTNKNVENWKRGVPI